MRRRVPKALAVAVLAMSCGGPPPERKPLAQESIGTNVIPPPSTQKTSTDASAPIPSVTDESANNPAEPSSNPDSPGPASKVGDLCPPKGKKADLSSFAARSGCRSKRAGRSTILTEIRGMEQLVASTTAGSNDREAGLHHLASSYAQLECSLAASCSNAKERETPVLPDDISLAEARRKTEQQCSTLRSEFPKSKRQCQ